MSSRVAPPQNFGESAAFNRGRTNIRTIHVVFSLSFVSALLLGVSSAIAVPGILACIVLSIFWTISSPRIPRVTFFAMLFVLYALLSAITFGGIASIGTSGLGTWLGGEGRFFLYYWPFIFLTLTLSGDGVVATRGLERILLALTIFAFLTVVVRQFGVKLYSSHHAAGAVLASLVIFNYFRYRARSSVSSLLFLIIAVAGLLGTGSRTSLLAAVIGMFIQQILLIRIGQIIKIAIFVPILAFGMSKVFPDQYTRLANTFTVNPFEVVAVNFERAWLANPPLESGNAWSLETLADKQGQANLAIRGLLWARGVVEGSRSPLFGAGFGRYNDTGRSFTQVVPFVTVATDAEYKNPSTHSSHNAFIMIFAELGLVGVALLGSIFVIVIRKCLSVLLRRGVSEDVKMWPSIALGCLVTLFLTGVTQHSFGAPIYGLSLVQLIAIGYSATSMEKKTWPA